MNKEEFIGKLQLVYIGDRNAFNEIVEDNQKLKNEIIYAKTEIDRLNETIEKKNTYYDNLAVDYRIEHEEKNRLNNIINEYEDKGYDIAQERADFLLEIQRLNNIIEELEKWCNECIDNHIIARENGVTTISDTFFEIVLDKLKELKENK